MNTESNVLLRMPWMFMTNASVLLQQNTSKITTFPCGRYVGHIKSIARVAAVDYWAFSHHPKLKNPMDANRSLLTYPDNHGWLTRSMEMETDSVTGCQLPKAGFLLRHFYTLSFEEYLHTRGNRTRSSDGTLLPERTLEGHRKWWDDTSGGNGSVRMCGPCGRLGEDSAMHFDTMARENILRKYQLKFVDPLRSIYRGQPLRTKTIDFRSAKGDAK